MVEPCSRCGIAAWGDTVRQPADPDRCFRAAHLADVEEGVDVGIEGLVPLLGGEVGEVLVRVLCTVVEDTARYCQQETPCTYAREGHIQSVKLAVEVEVLLDELLADLLFPEVVLEGLDPAGVVRLLLDEVDHLLCVLLLAREVREGEVRALECWMTHVRTMLTSSESAHDSPKRSATLRPMPLSAPVMMAFLPSSLPAGL